MGETTIGLISIVIISVLIVWAILWFMVPFYISDIKKSTAEIERMLAKIVNLLNEIKKENEGDIFKPG